ncbi:xanthine dehydrogenase family protein molybdopterin-binding subunit [Gluconacetobacter azotocaptans]|uniref:xanthine dehydrogenase family protein molybdopterin-binding subunit n=1 Tax=Gluconacetobacter azotocaptans TaxID=142834 RepID=UPI001958585F|nr:molybdopterin cofactor-binding domain-containing protein [Gluconacetobacter azotocaptans]MBM9401148.1 xanthine dehydrogenase family protein molybdopterin-binding subunit [Gluconacetobacter azotocaptans]
MSILKAASPLSRRSFLGGGALVVSFAMMPRAFAQLAGGGEGGAGPRVVAPNLPGSLKSTPWLDAWIRIDADGHITTFTGKAELGQGIRTALLQVVAEELDVAPGQIELVTVDTERTPDEGLTAGSHSMQDSGTALRNAAANVRMLLIQAAARTWGVAPDSIGTSGDGRLHGATDRTARYGEIAAALSLHVEAIPNVPLRDPKLFRTMGTALPRVDIPAKLTGGAAYVQDMRVPGMLHARVVRGPSVGTRLDPLNVADVEALAGVVKIVQVGSFVAVVADREWTAITALRRLQETGFVRTAAPIPQGDVVATLKSLPPEEIVVLDTHDATEPPARSVRARYTRPWLSHGSIGPSCAVAMFRAGMMTIWTHSQGTYDVRRVAAELLDLPPANVHAIHVEGAGCYGQNGADDVAAEAALIAKAVPGRPIRLQWMREQEFGWEPLGPAMVTEVTASLDAQNRIVAWNYDVWSNPHNNRPVGAGGVLVGGEVVPPFPAPEGKPIPMPEGDGDRNANPLYTLPNMHVLYHFLKDMPIRVSALRSLGAHLNVFSIESMFDELAKAGGVDPLLLRLAHMKDERARAVMQMAAEQFGWANRVRGDGRRGCGIGFARYKNLGAYCAVMLDIEVERETGRITVLRAVAAVDSGQPVNPDGIRNQVEGGIIQSLSWTTHEAATFDASRRTSFDWSSYPILRFADVPHSVEVHVIDSAGMPFLGTAECAQGPTSAALANALADAVGVRLREMPLSPERVKAAIGVI